MPDERLQPPPDRGGAARRSPLPSGSASARRQREGVARARRARPSTRPSSAESASSRLVAAGAAGSERDGRRAAERDSDTSSPAAPGPVGLDAPRPGRASASPPGTIASPSASRPGLAREHDRARRRRGEARLGRRRDASARPSVRRRRRRRGRRRSAALRPTGPGSHRSSDDRDHDRAGARPRGRAARRRDAQERRGVTAAQRMPRRGQREPGHRARARLAPCAIVASRPRRTRRGRPR